MEKRKYKPEYFIGGVIAGITLIGVNRALSFIPDGISLERIILSLLLIVLILLTFGLFYYGFTTFTADSDITCPNCNKQGVYFIITREDNVVETHLGSGLDEQKEDEVRIAKCKFCGWRSNEYFEDIYRK